MVLEGARAIPKVPTTAIRGIWAISVSPIMAQVPTSIPTLNYHNNNYIYYKIKKQSFLYSKITLYNIFNLSFFNKLLYNLNIFLIYINFFNEYFKLNLSNRLY